MKIKSVNLLALCAAFAFSATAAGAVYYVAPNGSDAAAGTLAAPLATLGAAEALVVPGDTVYLRGGTYTPVEPVAYTLNGAYACAIHLTKSGTAERRICWFAYPGERPKFDFTGFKVASKRLSGFWIDASWLHLRGIEVTGVQSVVTGRNTQSECFSNSGSHNIYELLEMHDGMGIGFFSRAGGNNLILNCDAWRNYDPVADAAGARNGGNVDGFGSHYALPGDGPNIFRGCRAWYNSDDGYDCINNGEATIIENCWAFYNGYSYEGEEDAMHPRGDGNGFKGGGYGRGPRVSELPVPVPRNTVRYCIAMGNKSKGFDANYHAEGNLWYNNSAYANNHNFHMETAGKVLPTDTVLTFIPGRNHFMFNNLSYAGRTTNLTRIVESACVMINNDFDLDGRLTDVDFVSLDPAGLMAPRKADGSLPDIDFMRPASGGTVGYYARP